MNTGRPINDCRFYTVKNTYTRLTVCTLRTRIPEIVSRTVSATTAPEKVGRAYNNKKIKNLLTPTVPNDYTVNGWAAVTGEKI